MLHFLPLRSASRISTTSAGLTFISLGLCSMLCLSLGDFTYPPVHKTSPSSSSQCPLHLSILMERGLEVSEIVYYTRRLCLYRITTLFPNERSRFEVIYVSSEFTTLNHFVPAAIVCQLSEYIFLGCPFLAQQRPVWEA